VRCQYLVHAGGRRRLAGDARRRLDRKSLRPEKQHEAAIAHMPDMGCNDRRGPRNAIRIGIVIWLASCGLLMPFMTAFTIQMRRIEGSRSILAYTQLALATMATLQFVIPYVFMLVPTYREDQPRGDSSPDRHRVVSS